MANSASAEKRIEVNKRNQLRNKAYKSTIRTIYKKCLIAINSTDENNMDSVNSLISLSYSKLDKAVQKNDAQKCGCLKKSSSCESIKEKRTKQVMRILLVK